MAETATPQLDDETLTGDIRDFMLLWVRQMQKPFEMMSETDQRNVIDSIEAKSRELIGGVISIVSGRGFERAFVKIGQFTVKEGIEAKIGAGRTERNLLNFNDFAGRSAMLIFADPQEFDGQRAPARVFKRQRDIEEHIKDQKEAEAKTPAADLPPGDPPAGGPVVIDPKPKKERKKKPEPEPVKTTDVDTSKPALKPAVRDLNDPATGQTLDASVSNPTRDRSLEDEHRLNENETIDPITGEIVEIKPAATLDDLFTKPAEEPDFVLVEETPAGDVETVWHPNPAQAETPAIPELPKHLKRVKNPAKPGTIDKNDPGEPETVTVNDDAPVERSRPTSAEPKVDEDFP